MTRARAALSALPRPEYQDRLTVLLNHRIDELRRGHDLQPLSAPPELRPRSRVAAANKVYPERIVSARRQAVGG